MRRLLGPDAVHALHAGGARQLPAGVTALLSRAALHGRKHRLVLDVAVAQRGPRRHGVQHEREIRVAAAQICVRKALATESDAACAPAEAVCDARELFLRLGARRHRERGVLSRVILVTALLVLGEDVQVRVLLGLPRAQRIRLHKVLPGCRLLPHVADAPTAPSACRGAAKPGVRLRSGAQRFSPVYILLTSHVLSPCPFAQSQRLHSPPLPRQLSTRRRSQRRRRPRQRRRRRHPWQRARATPRFAS